LIPFKESTEVLVLSVLYDLDNWHDPYPFAIIGTTTTTTNLPAVQFQRICRYPLDQM